jgi:hypothetical protein
MDKTACGTAKDAATRRIAGLCLVIGLVMAAAAAAEPLSPPHPVSELVVDGGPPPKVTASYPAQGAQAPGGVLVIKLVFDRAMAADSWSYSPVEGQAFPSCLAKPRLLGDGRTFALLCTVAADKSYALDINLSPAFASAGGRMARASRLAFTTGGTSVWAMHEALEQAGLTDADEPVMTWRDPGKGVSRSPPVEGEAPPPAAQAAASQASGTPR